MEKLNKYRQFKEKYPSFTKHQYKITLISKIKKGVKRMRWKILEFYAKVNDNNKETFGFNSIKCPPLLPELSELTLMVI